MITTLTLNPCIDRTITLESLSVGGTNRVLRVRDQISGKGINVALALTQLGYRARNLIFLYDADAGALADSVRERGMELAGISVPGRIRVNRKLFDESTRVMTECNEKGSPVEPAAAEQMMELVKQVLPDTEILIVDGSVPPGVGTDFYARLIGLAKAANVPVILDADNELFRLGVLAAPTLVKPNRNELEKYTGRSMRSFADVRAGAEQLLNLGIRYVCVSAGEEGAWLFADGECYYSKGAPIEVRGVQGAGDSLVAGLALGILRKESPREMLRLAVACADGSLTHEGTDMCTEEDLRRYLPLVAVETMGEE